MPLWESLLQGPRFVGECVRTHTLPIFVGFVFATKNTHPQIWGSTTEIPKDPKLCLQDRAESLSGYLNSPKSDQNNANTDHSDRHPAPG
jgi:hypothetical protein